MINKKKIYLFIIIIIFFLIDRVSKILILKSFLNNSLSEIYINFFLNLSLVWNSGIGFGLLQIEPNIFYSTVSIIIAAINLILIYWMITTSNYLESIFISIILGGSLGNLFDRFYYNSVPDFIDFHYKSFHWFTFNIADIFITIGIIGLIIIDLFKKKKHEKNYKFICFIIFIIIM
jgi:signal peptidase II